MADARSLAAWLLCVLFGLGLHASHGMGWLDRPWQDLLFGQLREHARTPVDNDVVVIGLDEEFLKAAPEPLALMHRRLAGVLEAVATARPRAVGIDFVLPEKSFSFLVPAGEPTVDFDTELSRGLLKLGNAAPLVIGEIWDQAHSRFRDIYPAFVAAAGYWVNKRGPAGFDFRGSALVCRDADGVVRQYPGAACQPASTTRTLIGQMAALAGHTGPLQGYVNYALGEPFNYLPAGRVVAWQQAGDSARLAQELAGKTVLIGVVLDIEDRIMLPVRLAQWEPDNRFLPGVVLQAQMLRSVLNQGLVQNAPTWVLVLLIALAGGFWFGHSVRLKLLCFALGGLALAAASLLALRANVFLPVGAVLATGTVALLTSTAAVGRRYWQERQHLTQTFTGYVSPQVLKGILSGALAVGKAGQRQQVCVLFSDIRDFTPLSEQLPAERVVELLNRYFDRMSHIIHQHGGLVDKFIGDGMMTLFGVPQALACPEQNALDAAREMLGAMQGLNAELAASGLPELRIGIGLHSGEAVIGHVGSQERHEYTAIGDTVNVAARVCDLPKVLGAPLVCTEAVARALGFPAYLTDAGVQKIKGHAGVRVFTWSKATLSATPLSV